MKGRKQLRRHARQRAFERYEFKLTEAQRLELLRRIRTGDVVRSMKMTNTRTLHVVIWNEQEFVLIYSKRLREIVTFLPRDTWQLEHGDDDQD